MQGLAQQVAIGADGSIFALDNVKNADGFGIWKLDSVKNKWRKVGSGAEQIAVGADGKPYIVGGDGEISWPNEPCSGDFMAKPDETEVTV